MKAFYCDHFVLPLPPEHRFPMAKYARLRQRVAAELPGVCLCEPLAASDPELTLAHDSDYIDRLGQGLLSAAEVRRIGFPWSPEMVERSRRSVGATVAACRSAAQEGIAVNLAGGTHHAHAGHGEGFCCFNDVAVAARLLLSERRARHVLIVDLDVHQGNGTAAILGEDRGVFTLSLHGENNYPFRKARSTLDVALADGTDDAAYLSALARALDQVEADFDADFVIFVAGADVYQGDRLGRLHLTRDGIAQRDALVLDWARIRERPVAITMGGGYCPDIDEVVAIHFETVRRAAALYSPAPGSRAVARAGT